MFALPLKEVVIAAAVFDGMFAAQRGAGFIDRAAARLGIEKAATAFENRVFLMAHHVMAVIFLEAREFLFGGFISQAMMFRQSLDVGLGDFDPVIGAAITGTLRAIVFQARRFQYG